MDNILDLPGWQIQSVTQTDGERTVTATYQKSPTACVKCGCTGDQNGGFLKFGSTHLSVTDMPAYGKKTTILVTRQRYRCRDCGATFVQPLPDLDTKGTMTKRLVAFIEKESLRKTFVDVAEQIGVTEGTVRNVFHAYVNQLEETVTFRTPRVLGIDELHLLGEPRCILTDIEARSIVGLLSKRTKDIVYRHLSMMPDRHGVEVVTMDMWNPYKDAVRAAMPGAAIVVDKYHVVSLADRAMEKVRKELRSSVTKKMGRELMRSRYILLKRPKKLNERDMLLRDVWLQQFPMLATAYKLKEAFHDLYEASSAEEARERYQEWQGMLTLELRTDFKDVTTAMSNWSDEVFAYFDHRYTNAYTEAFNGIIKKANSTGRGYSFDVIRAKMLYVNAVHKIPVKPVNIPREKETFEMVKFEDIHEPVVSIGADLINAMAAFEAKFPGHVLLLDDPEAYLHPGGPSTLAAMIMEIVETGQTTSDYE